MSSGRWSPFLALLAGCALQPIGPVPPGMSGEDYAVLQSSATFYLDCPRERITYEALGKGRHLLKGCDQQIEMLPGQNGFAHPAAANRFSKEFKCDLRLTTEERIDHRTHVVEGCGQRVVYMQVCDWRCSWVANGEGIKR